MFPLISYLHTQAHWARPSQQHPGAYTRWPPRTHNPLDPRPSGHWRYHKSFSLNGKPGKMIEPEYVAKRPASTGLVVVKN